MKKQIIFGLFALMLALGACTDPKMEKVVELQKAAIEVHDEVMPRMGEIHDLEMKIKKLRKNYESDTAASAQVINDQLRDQLQSLDIANESMMDWMADYVVDYEKSAPADSAIVYYQQQMEEIKDVKLKMEKSISDAEKFVETFQD
jgi:hypothetical protein